MKHEVILYLDLAPFNKHMEIIWKRLLNDKCRLADIPRELRLSEKGIYITAFRSDTISTERYKEDLKLMKSDVCYLNRKADNWLLKDYVESLSRLHKDMEYWITRCWDYEKYGEKTMNMEQIFHFLNLQYLMMSNPKKKLSIKPYMDEFKRQIRCYQNREIVKFTIADWFEQRLDSRIWLCSRVKASVFEMDWVRAALTLLKTVEQEIK